MLQYPLNRLAWPISMTNSVGPCLLIMSAISFQKAQHYKNCSNSVQDILVLLIESTDSMIIWLLYIVARTVNCHRDTEVSWSKYYGLVI